MGRAHRVAGRRAEAWREGKGREKRAETPTPRAQGPSSSRPFPPPLDASTRPLSRHKPFSFGVKLRRGVSSRRLRRREGRRKRETEKEKSGGGGSREAIGANRPRVEGPPGRGDLPGLGKTWSRPIKFYCYCLRALACTDGLQDRVDGVGPNASYAQNESERLGQGLVAFGSPFPLSSSFP